MTVKEQLKELKKLNPYKSVMIVRNDCILALSDPKYLIFIADSRDWGKQEVTEVKQRLDDVLLTVNA